MKINRHLSMISLCYLVLEIALFIFSIAMASYRWSVTTKYAHLPFITYLLTSIIILIIMSISKIIFIINNSLTTKLKVIFILTSLVFFILTLKPNKTKESFSYSHKKFMIFIGCWLALLAIIILINMWSTGFFISGVASRSVETISVPYYAWWAGVLLVHTIIYFIYRRVYVTKRSKQDKQSKHINS